jgi:hypothetical protein
MRRLLCLLAFCCAVVVAPAAVESAVAAQPADGAAEADASAAGELRSLVGENRLYAIDFLFFRKLAAGELHFEETDQPGIYRAQLVGRTLGVASWLAGDRTQVYTSLLELTPAGRLRSIEHVADIEKRRWGRTRNWQRVHRYDYRKGRVIDEKYKAGKLKKKEQLEIPAGQEPVDMLAAFYNLRIGVYGPLERGAHYLIPTYSDDGFTDIEVDVLTIEEQAKIDLLPRNGLLVKARIDPEIFDTDSGDLFIWFDDSGVPARGIVEDLVGLGDVRGYLDREEAE